MSSVLQADRCQLWKLCAFQLVFLTHVLHFGSSGIFLTRAWGFILEYLIHNKWADGDNLVKASLGKELLKGHGNVSVSAV